jgi:hypothetical protein
MAGILEILSSNALGVEFEKIFECFKFKLVEVWKVDLCIACAAGAWEVGGWTCADPRWTLSLRYDCGARLPFGPFSDRCLIVIDCYLVNVRLRAFAGM